MKSNDGEWSLEDELPKECAQATDEALRMVENIERELSNDVGFASEPENIDILARMYSGDRANYARCEQALRKFRLLGLVRAAVRSRARQWAGMAQVPGGGESLNLIRVKSLLPKAPVSDDAVVPASWVIGTSIDGTCHYMLTKTVVRRKDGDLLEERIGVAYSPIVVSASVTDIDDGSTSLQVAWRSKGVWRQKIVPRQKLCQPKDLIESLSGSDGFPAHVNNAKDIIAYLADYEAHNGATIATQKSARQMGWQGKACELGFVAGTTHIRDADQEAIKYVGGDDGDAHLSKCVRGEGTIDGWRDAVKAASNFPAVELSIYAALAPPFLRILRASNFVVDWSHKTSAGKTTTLSLGASVWGNPDPHASDSYMSSWDMTPVGFERRAAALSHMPMVVDDTKRARSYRGESIAPNVVYEITNGQGRTRGSVKGMQRTAYWRTVMLSSGEQRLIDMDKSGGTPARVVTLWCNPFGVCSPAVADSIASIKRGILANYGLAGPALVLWLIEHRAKWDEIRALYARRRDELRGIMVEMQSGPMDMAVIDRVAGHLAVLDVTAIVTHRALHLPWGYEGAVEELIPVILPAITLVDRELEALRDAVSWAAQNRGRFCMHESHRSESEPNGGWLGYWEAAQVPQWRILAFFPDALRQFLSDRGYPPAAIMRQWREAGWLDCAGEPWRMTTRVNDLGGRPRMVCITRAAVEAHGGLDDDGQGEIPF